MIEVLAHLWTARDATETQSAAVYAGPRLIATIQTDHAFNEIAAHIADVHNASLAQPGPAGLRAELEATKTEADAAQALVNALRAQLADAQATIADRAALIRQLDTKAAGLEKRNADQANEIAALKRQAAVDRRNAAVKLAQADAEIDALRKEAAGLRIEADAARRQLDEADALIARQAAGLDGTTPAGLRPIEIARRLAELRRRIEEDSEAPIDGGDQALLYDVARALDLSHEQAAAVAGDKHAGRPTIGADEVDEPSEAEIYAGLAKEQMSEVHRQITGLMQTIADLATRIDGRIEELDDYTATLDSRLRSIEHDRHSHD